MSIVCDQAKDINSEVVHWFRPLESVLFPLAARGKSDLLTAQRTAGKL